MTEPTYEHHFVTQDRDADGNPLFFNLIEDESGDIWYGYGHVPPAEFVAEINRWLEHCGVFEDEWTSPVEADSVQHVYAYNYDGERFKMVADLTGDGLGETFPITRLWV